MNNNRFTYNGTIHEILPVKTFSSGFKKRDIVCAVKNGEYTDYAVFTAKKDLADKVGTLKKGDGVAIDFVLDGHAWNDQKESTLKWFGGATVLKVELTSGINAGSLNLDAKPEPAVVQADDVAEDIPF